ncbi:hypothetical protein D5266_09575, partial [bacterium c-19]|nr:hypothetical protein [bacterium c-19]
MRKKLMIICIALIAVFSIGYTYFNLDMYAASGLNTINEGDRIIVGKDNTGHEIVWTASKKNTGELIMYHSLGSAQFCNSNTNNIAYTYVAGQITRCDFYTTASGKSHSPVYLLAKNFNDAYSTNRSENQFENSAVRSVSNTVGNLQYSYVPKIAQIVSGELGNIANLPAAPFYLSDTGYVKHNHNLVYGTFFIKDGITEKVYPSASSTTPLPGYISYFWGYHPDQQGNGWANSDAMVFSHLNNTNILYALNYDINKNVLTSKPRSGVLKIRYADPSYMITFNDMKYKGQSVSGNKILKDQIIQLDAIASGTLSVFVYDEMGNDLLYYKALNDNNFDLSGIPAGKYKIAVANEDFDDSTGRPAKSSPISSMKNIEIVEPHKLTYTKTPQSGATSGNDYEFSKNVNAGQAVGKITVNPQGVMPLTYTVESNGDTTYQNFELDGLNGSNASSSTSLNVKIKGDAPDLMDGGLKAGTYKFCITAVDANGDPVDTNGDPTEKVCTTFTVAKTNPTITFDDPNQTKKSVADAATAWNETATATPSTGTKITYSVSGGDAYLIEIDEDSGEITYKGNGGFGKVKIKATVDDDPSSGNDNYNSAFTEKEIVIYQEVDGHVNPDGNSSNTTVPTFTASDSNIKINGIIGTIIGTKGTSTSLDNSQPTYRYGVKAGEGDANFFSVDSNSGVIKTTANLGVKSYHITVTVSDSWSTKEIPVIINVGVAAAEDLKFYETTAAVNAITSKSVKVTDTGVVVFATVKGSMNNNPVKYKIKDGSTNVIEINENSGAVTI